MREVRQLDAADAHNACLGTRRVLRVLGVRGLRTHTSAGDEARAEDGLAGIDVAVERAAARWEVFVVPISDGVIE